MNYVIIATLRKGNASHKFRILFIAQTRYNNTQSLRGRLMPPTIAVLYRPSKLSQNIASNGFWAKILIKSNGRAVLRGSFHVQYMIVINSLHVQAIKYTYDLHTVGSRLITSLSMVLVRDLSHGTSHLSNYLSGTYVLAAVSLRRDHVNSLDSSWRHVLTLGSDSEISEVNTGNRDHWTVLYRKLPWHCKCSLKFPITILIMKDSFYLVQFYMFFLKKIMCYRSPCTLTQHIYCEGILFDQYSIQPHLFL